jgi:hypothetical protein
VVIGTETRHDPGRAEWGTPADEESAGAGRPTEVVDLAKPTDPDPADEGAPGQSPPADRREP